MIIHIESNENNDVKSEVHVDFNEISDALLILEILKKTILEEHLSRRSIRIVKEFGVEK